MIPAAPSTHECRARGEPWATAGCISDFPSRACKLGLELTEEGGQMDAPQKRSMDGDITPLAGLDCMHRAGMVPWSNASRFRVGLLAAASPRPARERRAVGRVQAGPEQLCITSGFPTLQLLQVLLLVVHTHGLPRVSPSKQRAHWHQRRPELRVLKEQPPLSLFESAGNESHGGAGGGF